MLKSNPLLQPWATPFGVPPFHQIKRKHYEPAITQLIEKTRKEIDAIAHEAAAPTFENTVVALERTGEALNQAADVLFNLNAAETSPEMQMLAAQIAPLLTAFGNETLQNEALFARIQSVYDGRQSLKLDREDEMLLTKTYKDFARSGAHLSAADKEKYNAHAAALTKASLKFGEHVLAETNGYALVIENESDLSGLPPSAIEAAALAAKQSGREGAWVFTLHAPSFVPFMEYADQRALREELYKAYMSRAFKGDEADNQALVKEIVRLRYEIAKLLGYDTYADYVLEERMAETPQKVMGFLNELLEKALPKARQEVEEVKAFIQKQGQDLTLERWDWAYYSRKLKEARYALDDEQLRPYFKLEHVVEGVFEVARRLYGLSFVKQDLPVYHPQVVAYEVVDEAKNHVAICYMDFFPRQGKQGGAWMTAYRGQWKDRAEDHRPIVAIVCNFTPPTESKPSLLTFREVETLFHEFGHALHGMLADGKYRSLSGTHVYWDFVELPSQLLENWMKERECLDLFAKHYETGELIPQALVQKIKDAANHHEGYQTLRQIGLGWVDMAWHSIKGEEINIEDVLGFEKEAMRKTDLFRPVEGACLSTQFSHIFEGGYAAGYYSYKWAEVLDADAFSVFKKHGIFDSATAQSFKANILSKGGSEHPMTLYQRFRGQAPTLDALLERSGLVVSDMQS